MWVLEWLGLPTSDQKVLDLNPPGGRIQLMTVWRSIAQRLPLSSFCYLDMTSNVERDVKHCKCSNVKVNLLCSNI